jgi:exopolyphosphatase/guanosine-5'-triphosphate,3'-diphosphate pyrophosphatase
LKNAVKETAWQDMKGWIRDNTADYHPVDAIGTGGNINKLFKLSRIKDGSPISYKRIRRIYKDLSTYSLEERIVDLGLRPDRADVILPASEIYLSTMKWARAERMYVPGLGLPDGMVHLLHERHKEGAAQG